MDIDHGNFEYDNRYHRDAYGIPDDLWFPSGEMSVNPRQHAREEAADPNKKDRNQISIPSTVTVEEDRIVEVYTRNGHTVRFVGRDDYDDKYALCYVLDLESDMNLVTVWLNKYDDDHDTLDKSLYDKP